MESAIVTTQDNGKILESVILKGDISALSPIEKVQYYKAVCESVGLNPLTQPLAYIVLNGKSTLYAKRDATDQLRKIHGVSVTSCKNERVEDVYIVSVGVSDKDGRTDMGTGAVTIGNLKGDALANALMKAETKAKRRATLSICGLGLLDETELETIHDKPKSTAQPVAERVAAMLAPPAPIEASPEPQAALSEPEPVAEPRTAPPQNGIHVWEGSFGSLDASIGKGPMKLRCFDGQEEKVFDSWGEPSCLAGLNLKLLVGHPVRVEYQIRTNTKGTKTYYNNAVEHLELIGEDKAI